MRAGPQDRQSPKFLNETEALPPATMDDEVINFNFVKLLRFGCSSFTGPNTTYLN